MIPPNGRLTIYSCTQALYFSMGVVAAHLQVPLNKLKKSPPGSSSGAVTDPDKMVKVQVASDIK